MADAQANINVNLDATQALAQLKTLQRQISLFNAEIARGGAQAAAGASRMQQNLINSINASGQFSASLAKTRTTTESFTNALEKNKFSMQQYFRYAGGATQKFGHLFSKEMGVVDKVARERVKTLQTQYIKLGRDASGAMKSIAVRPLALDMKDVATQTALAAQKQQIFNQLLKQGSTNLLNWGKNTQWAGRQLMVGFTIPLSIFGAAAASSFMKLEEQAIRFKRVYGDLFTTPEMADQAFADMQKLGQEFTKYGVAVEETIGLAATVAQMGKTGADLTAQVTEATRLAVLGGMEQQEALDTTISLTNAFGVAAEDLANKINFLNAAENQTILSIQDFNEAVPRAGSVVAQLGGDVEDLAFFLTAMREGGIEATQGANALKSSLGRLINPTQRAKDALAGYGIDVVGIVEQNQGNLRQTILDLGTALDQLDPLEKARAIETLFGKFQFARMSALFQNIMSEGSQAATILNLINSEAGDLATIAGRELGRVEQSAATKFRSAVEQFQVALAPIGESFLKLVTPIIEFGAKILNVFNNMSDGAKAVVVGIIGVVGGIGPVLLMTVGLIANGIANLIKMFAFFRERLLNVKNGTRDLGSQTQYLTQEQLEAAAVAASLGQEHAELQQIFTSERVAVDNLRAAYERMTAVQRGALGVSGVAAAGATGAARAKGFRYGKKVPGYKDGVVMVPGRKGEGDTQPAMLSPGEAVIPAKMAERYAPLINAMIAGNIPGYQKGKASPTKPVASHIAELSPTNLSEFIQNLTAVDGVFGSLSKTVWELKDNAQTGQRELHAYSMSMSDLSQKLASEDYNVFAGGATFSGTTLVGSQSQNAMFEALMPGTGAGVPATLDTLLNTAEMARQEQQENTAKYQQHSAEMDQLIAQADVYEKAIANGADAEELKAQYVKDIAEQLLTEQAVTKDNISVQEARQQAIQKLNEIDSRLLSAKEKELAYLGAAISNIDELVIAPASMGTEAPRQVARGARYASGTPQELRPQTVGETPTGRVLPGKQVANIAALSERLGIEAGQVITINATKGLETGLKQGLQTASPSKVTQREMKNASDGAVAGIRQGQDDMQAAGIALADAAEAGVRSGTGGPGGRRVQTRGPVTPGQPINYSILNGQLVQASIRTQNFGRSLEKAAIKVAGMGAKIGAFGIGISSLIGGIAMVPGPLGEFASKLFPLVSLMTGLSFAMQMLTPEIIKSVGARISESLASGRNARAKVIEAASSARAAAASNAVAAADTRQAIASNAATRGLAAMTATSMFLGGGPLGKTVGNAFGAITKSANLFVGTVGRAAKGLVGVLGRVGGSLGAILARVGGAVVGFGGFLSSLLGPVGLVVAGLALLAGGIVLLNNVVQKSRDKISGLGDAANLSADKLKTLNEIIPEDLVLPTPPTATESGLAVEGAEAQATAADIQKDLLESEDFKKDFSGIIDALSDASVEAGEIALTQLAVTLQTAGASEESIAAIVNALLAEAGRTDIQLEFGSIEIANAQQTALDALDMFRGTVAEAQAQGRSGAAAYSAETGDFEVNAATALGGRDAAAELELVGASLASTFTNLNAQLAAGNIELDEYTAQINMLQQGLDAVAASGPAGLATARLALGETVSQLEEQGYAGIQEQAGGLLDTESLSGFRAAQTVVQATTAGFGLGSGAEGAITEEEMAVLEAGAAEDRTIQEVKASMDLIDAIEQRIEVRLEENKAVDDYAAAVDAVEIGTGAIEAETDALVEKHQAYDDAVSVLDGYAEVVDKEAMARQIANDEELRGLFLDAQAADLAAGNTEQTDKLVGALNDQAQARANLNAQEAAQNIQDAITEAKERENALAGLTEATGDAAIAQGILNNSMAYGLVAAELTKRGVDIATASASEIAAAIEESGVMELIQGLIAVGGLEVPDLSVGGSGGGGAKEDPASFLDDIVKQYRDFGDASQELTKGFDASLEAIMNFAEGGAWGLNGLARQLRTVNVSEPLIEKFLGMDPEEWEKIKPKLFDIDNEGNITGLNAQGQAVQQAAASATIAEETANIESQTAAAEDQITAFNILRSSGASVALAYEMIKNKALASAIATSKNTAEVKRLIEAQKQLLELEKEIEEINEEEMRKQRIRDAVRDMNKEFEDQVKALNKIRAATDKYSDEQIRAIFGNKDLKSLFLEPNIDKKALEKALANAERQAKLELDIKLLTFEGREDYLNEAFKKAKEKLSAEETRIELEFEADVKGPEETIRNAQNEIDSLAYMIDDYQAQLDEIQYREDEINEKYDKRFEALDKIAGINEKIAQQQQNQLDLAEALSRGDIAAAAQAAQAAREQEMQDNMESQRDMMEMRREAELESVKSIGGLTRKQLEDQIDSLNRKITEIEETRLEPAEEYVRLAELRRDAEIANLEVLGRTSGQWDEIQNALDVARTRNYEFMNELRDQFSMYPEVIAKYLEGEKLPAPPPLPPPPKSSGGGGGGRARLNSKQKRENARAWQSHVAQVNAGTQKPHSFSFPNKVTSDGSRVKTGQGAGYAFGGLVRAMAMGGYVKGGMFKNMSMGGSTKDLPMGYRKPTPLGSDVVPAMLTPGEFVIRRPAVQMTGIDTLEKINRGTYSGGSVYNYSLQVNVRSNSNPDQIANTVMREIKRVDSQRLRNNRY